MSDHVATPKQPGQAKPGSFRHICVLYYASPTFKRLDSATQRWRRRFLDQISETYGHKPIAGMQPKHIRMLRDELSAKQASANQLLKSLKALFAWGCEEAPEFVSHNPTLEVKKIKYVSTGHHTWTDEEIGQYRQHHPLGTKARLALELLLNTAGRREDAVRLGPQHIRNSRIQFVQAKNEHKAPRHIDIPLLPELADAIKACATVGLTSFLVTRSGVAYTPTGFTNWFKIQCERAGLPHCVAHGLRKSAGVRLAEAGATAHEIIACLGCTLGIAELYCKASQQARLADAAMAKLNK